MKKFLSFLMLITLLFADFKAGVANSNEKGSISYHQDTKINFNCKFNISPIKVLSPTKENIDYNYLTLKVSGMIFDIKAKVNGVEYFGVRNNSDSKTKLFNKIFYIYNIALKKGKNEIKLIANKGTIKKP